MVANTSFVDVPQGSDFPLENLPWGVFSTDKQPRERIGVALGGSVVDVSELVNAGLFSGPVLSGKLGAVLQESTLNGFMGLGSPAWREARHTLTRLLSSSESVLRDNAELRARALIPLAEARMALPATVGDYTDFYASRYHAFNCGALFRGPGQELQPNWVHLPVAYHGRSSSLVVSGAGVVRPWGQILPAGASTPIFTPSRALDFELEMGALIGPGNELGTPVHVENASAHLFGYVLLNDWSARDIQKWEYVPLGPFLGKSWATQISPWVVTLDALEPFTVDAPPQDPEVLPYLKDSRTAANGDHTGGHAHHARLTHDVHLSVDLLPSGSTTVHRICNSNLRHVYWTYPQMVAHHTVNGCNLRPGDLLGTGTISGPGAGEVGCLLELTRGGQQPLVLGGSSGAPSISRTYLQDGDTVVFHGWCEGEGKARIGFGECSGVVLPARPAVGAKA